MTFDEFIVSCAADSVNAYPSNGDGTCDGKPCGVCGSQTFLLDPTPVCLVCDANVNNTQAALERIVCALDVLAELGAKLPEAEKVQLSRDLDIVLFGIAKVGMAVR